MCQVSRACGASWGVQKLVASPGILTDVHRALHGDPNASNELRTARNVACARAKTLPRRLCFQTTANCAVYGAFRSRPVCPALVAPFRCASAIHLTRVRNPTDCDTLLVIVVRVCAPRFLRSVRFLAHAEPECFAFLRKLLREAASQPIRTKAVSERVKQATGFGSCLCPVSRASNVVRQDLARDLYALFVRRRRACLRTASSCCRLTRPAARP